MRLPTGIGLLLVLAASCSRNLRPADDDTGDDELQQDTDTDTDTDTDSDTDADSDTDTDTEPEVVVLCEDPYETPSPGVEADGCLTEELRCGDFIEATTVGGSTSYDDDFYGALYCDDTRELEYSYDEPERAYEMTVEADTLVTFTLYTPCEGHVLKVIQANDPCAAAQTTGDCHSVNPTEETQVVEFANASPNPLHVEVVVDTQEVPGNFALQVDCE